MCEHTHHTAPREEKVDLEIREREQETNNGNENEANHNRGAPVHALTEQRHARFGLCRRCVCVCARAVDFCVTVAEPQFVPVALTRNFLHHFSASQLMWQARCWPLTVCATEIAFDRTAFLNVHRLNGD